MAKSAEVVPLKRPEPPKEALAGLPDDDHDLLTLAHELTEICRENQGQRASYYRFLHMITEAGRIDGSKSLLNLMYSLLDRLASMLYSPTDLRFSVDFENDYEPEITARATRVARLVGRSWERSDTDIQFSQGVFASCEFGAAILKQWPTAVGPNKIPNYNSAILMPWQFGVYKPDSDNLDEQPALCESSLITLPEVWRRIHHLPDARKIFERIKESSTSAKTSMENSLNHPVLLAAQMQFNQPTRPVPGGIVQIGATGGLDGAIPDSTAPKVLFHELWVWDKADYTTIQWIEPDILIAPLMRKSNLLIPGEDSGIQPYNLIQANKTHGNIWGRSELADLFQTQDFLSTTMDDIKNVWGLQIDRILAFAGQDGITAEDYPKAKQAGYFNLGAGGSVTDLTPKFPPEAIPLIDKIIQLIEIIAGFDNLLSGRGEPGVRSGAQANPMMRTAGARLKDRSLIIERQCANAADKRLSLMEAKDGRRYWTDPKQKEETGFLLSDLPDDRRIVVDGHTSSPIFADDHAALMTNGLKLGVVDKVSYIEAMPFPNKDVLIERLKEAAEKQAKQMEELKRIDPEGFAKALEKGIAGGRHR
jgi:hypothetical protein